jgi:hypothetical protein
VFLAKQAKQAKQGIGRVPYFPENRYIFNIVVFPYLLGFETARKLPVACADSRNWLRVGTLR